MCLELLCTSTQSSNLKWVSGGGINNPRHQTSRWLKAAKKGVNTKNWYTKNTDLWAEFGKEMSFGRKISSKDSVEILAVGNTPSFGRRTVYAQERKFSGIRDDVARI
jgi:hypothetical protein